MEIIQIDKDITNQLNQKIITLSKNYKQLKLLFLQLNKEIHDENIQAIKQSIQQRTKSITEHLEINQKKVLNAYICYHLVAFQDGIGRSQMNLRGITDKEKNESVYYSNKFITQSIPTKKNYHNRLFESFKQWFDINIQMKNHKLSIRSNIRKQNIKNQQLLIILTKQLQLKSTSSSQKRLPIQDVQQQNSQRVKNYCQHTLILILIVQLNQSILLLQQHQFKLITQILQKIEFTYGILQQKVKQKAKQIQKYIKVIQEFEHEQKQQLKKFYLKCRKTQLVNMKQECDITINRKNTYKNKYHNRQLSIDINKQRQKERQMQIQYKKQEQEQKEINRRYGKKIDEVIGKKKEIIVEKLRLEYFLKRFRQRYVHLQTIVKVYTDSEFVVYWQGNKVNSKVKVVNNSTKGNKNIEYHNRQHNYSHKNTSHIKFFHNEKLNTALQKLISQKQSQNQPSQQQPKLLDILFFTNTSTQKSIFLSVDRNKKNIQISIKDYYNLCLLLKKNKQNKQAIIYLQILLYQYKKKQFLQQYCLRNYTNEKYLFQQSMMNSTLNQFQWKFQDIVWEKMFQRFVKNQELLKVYVFSMVNLVELYQLEGSNHWAFQTMKFVSKFIEQSVLRHLEDVFKHINKKQQVVDENVNVTKQIRQERSQSQYSCKSLLQKQCKKKIDKYTKYLQQINYKIIKSSFNIFVKQTSQNLKKNQTSSSSKTSSLDPKQSKSILLLRSLHRKKRLQEKQNELDSILNSTNNTNRLQQNLSNSKNYYSCTLTPNKTGFNSNNLSVINSKNQSFIINQLKNHEKLQKGSVYKINSSNFKKKKISKNVIQVKRQEANEQKMGRNPDRNALGLKNTKQSQLIVQKAQKNVDVAKKTKNQVKFNLQINDDKFQPSLKQFGSIKSIASSRKLKKNQTLNFLQTAKSINVSTKLTRLVQFRQKLLQNRQQLQQYIQLSFKKLQSLIKNPFYSTISLNEIKTQSLDISMQVDKIFSDFNQLLASLKVFISHSDESFQRQLLIESKIKMAQLVNKRIKAQRLIQIYQQLLSDIFLVKNTQKKVQLKRNILYKLASEYFDRNQLKKSLQAYLQIGRLGDNIGYLKMGQIYMINQDYNNAIRYFQKYAIQKNFDLFSKIKIAHAYSKIPQYYMKTIDMLMGILIQNGSYSKFKQQIYERRYDDKLVESGVILLSSLYFKSQNIQKAIDLCQNYNKINIKNYRVLHILGGYYRYQNNKKKSFQCYLNSLENNPSYHKSLIELTQFVCENFQYKSHAVELVRKCYKMENRNVQLLQTLVKFLDQKENQNSSQNNKQTSGNQIKYEQLLKYAQILKQSKNKGYSSQNFYDQASLVYQWALSLLQKNISIGNLDQVQKIYKNLGQICLNKGDYIKSESYYKLYLLQIQKYVNHSNLDQNLKQQKIIKTKMNIYNLLGKVKKQQKKYLKSIQYYEKSYELQIKHNKKLNQELFNYFQLFQIGYCYFYINEHQKALEKFMHHKNYLLQLISQYDKYWFTQERGKKVELPQTFTINIRNKFSAIKQFNMNHNQNEQNSNSDSQFQPEQKQNQYILKKNYFETQLYIAFCYDKLCNFIESKQIYKKIIQFFEMVEYTIEEQKIIKSTKKIELKSQERKKKLQNIRNMTVDFDEIKQDYKEFIKISLINLANIYKLEGIENKYKETIRKYIQICPVNMIQKSTLIALYQKEFSVSSDERFGGRKIEDKHLNLNQIYSIKVIDETNDILSKNRQKSTFNHLKIGQQSINSNFSRSDSNLVRA